MQMKQFLGIQDNLKNDSIEDTPLQLNLGGWKKALRRKIIGNNDVSAYESLPLDYARHSYM